MPEWIGLWGPGRMGLGKPLQALHGYGRPTYARADKMLRGSQGDG